MSRPAVSVIIPTYNYGRFVTEAVDSVLAQTCQDLEVIVLDDGSTDDTSERLAPYNDRVRYIRQTNQGPSATRNNAIEVSRGEFIAFLDADDVWHPQKLEAQLAYVSRHPEVGLHAADGVVERPTQWQPLPSSLDEFAADISLDALVIRARFAPSGVMIRKTYLDEAGRFDPTLRWAEDRDLWLRIASRHRVSKLCLPLWWYRFHANNASSAAVSMETNEREMLDKAFREIDALRGRFVLRQRALSHAAFAAALMYDNAHRPWTALARIVRSFVLFPWPHRRSDVNVPLVRSKRLLRIAGRLAHDAGRSAVLATSGRRCGC